jgi:hypothetical protein
MANMVYSEYNFGLVYDGVSTSLGVDLTDAIATDNSIHNKVPQGVYDNGINPTPSSITVSGNTVTINWTTAPPISDSGTGRVGLKFLGV